MKESHIFVTASFCMALMLTSCLSSYEPRVAVTFRFPRVGRADRSLRCCDATEKRIGWLTMQKLERIANDSSGWETLCRDP